MGNGDMAVGVSDTDVMVRAGDAAQVPPAELDVRPFDMSGKKMRGRFLVESSVRMEVDDVAR